MPPKKQASGPVLRVWAWPKDGEIALHGETELATP